MIDRMALGILPDKPHTAFRDAQGKLFYEEMFTRGGFDDGFTYFYHRHPITPHLEVTDTRRGYAAAIPDEAASHPLKRRLYASDRVPSGGQLLDKRTPIFTNSDVTIHLARPTETDDAYFANGDADELWFIHEGRARIESPCGWLDVKENDYVFVPRSMIHRWHVESPLRLLNFEFHGGMHVPKQFRNPVGQLRMDAPYTHRDFVRPSAPIATAERVLEGPRELFVRKGRKTGRYLLANSPMDVVGWDGTVYPFAFDILKYQPKTSMVHLPPTIHTTFAGRGALICSFVPRPVDFHPQAIPCPYPHSSVDCDEVILYLRGNFTSRRGVGPGSISLHPSGISHGPHPGAYEASIGTTKTDELAVMIDSYLPLLPTVQATNIEEPGYHASWTI